MLETSNLQTMRFGKPCFWPKIEAILQKSGGFAEIILHFFSRFPGFLEFLPLQSVAFQGQAAIKTLQKKSCLKTYRRFFVRSGLCHNRRMNGKTVQWEMGQENSGGGPKGPCSASGGGCEFRPRTLSGRPPSNGRRDAAPSRKRGRLRYGLFAQAKAVGSRRSKSQMRTPTASARVPQTPTRKNEIHPAAKCNSAWPACG
jgi:hypothetical protein